MFQTGFVKYGVLVQHRDIYGQSFDKDTFISQLSHLDIKNGNCSYFKACFTGNGL